MYRHSYTILLDVHRYTYTCASHTPNLIYQLYQIQNPLSSALTVIRVLARTMGVNILDPQISDTDWSIYLLLTRKSEQYRLYAVDKSVLPSAAHGRPTSLAYGVRMKHCLYWRRACK